ncbi:MAG: hypothetical protein GX572_01210 [Clostridia bacterium]|nr:hypothetical protein [Clostridia bacterium]
MYPRIIIDRHAILANARVLRDQAARRGVDVTPVVKALAGHKLVADIVSLGFKRIADAGLEHIRAYADLDVDIWFLRNPLACEAEELVRLTTGCLVSEAAALRLLETEAERQGKIYQVLLMAELGDLREGCEEEELLSLAALAEILPHIELMGLGANLSCYGNILPDEDNMARLVELQGEAEQRISRRLPLLSGGNSSSYRMLSDCLLPPAINDLRFGESILLGRLPCYDEPIEGLRQETFIVETQLVEVKTKPSLPWGSSGDKDSFGGVVSFTDKGRRRRALAALGKQEIQISGLSPEDCGIELLGGCSDYLVLDVTDGERDYQVGDTVRFICDYAAVATAMSSPCITKIYA